MLAPIRRTEGWSLSEASRPRGLLLADFPEN